MIYLKMERRKFDRALLINQGVEKLLRREIDGLELQRRHFLRNMMRTQTNLKLEINKKKEEKFRIMIEKQVLSEHFQRIGKLIDPLNKQKHYDLRNDFHGVLSTDGLLHGPGVQGRYGRQRNLTKHRNSQKEITQKSPCSVEQGSDDTTSSMSSKSKDDSLMDDTSFRETKTEKRKSLSVFSDEVLLSSSLDKSTESFGNNEDNSVNINTHLITKMEFNSDVRDTQHFERFTSNAENDRTNKPTQENAQINSKDSKSYQKVFETEIRAAPIQSRRSRFDEGDESMESNGSEKTLFKQAEDDGKIFSWRQNIGGRTLPKRASAIISTPSQRPATANAHTHFPAAEHCSRSAGSNISRFAGGSTNNHFHLTPLTARLGFGPTARGFASAGSRPQTAAPFHSKQTNSVATPNRNARPRTNNSHRGLTSTSFIGLTFSESSQNSTSANRNCGGNDPGLIEGKHSISKYRKRSARGREHPHLSLLKQQLDIQEADYTMALRKRHQQIENENVVKKVWDFIGRRPISVQCGTDFNQFAKNLPRKGTKDEDLTEEENETLMRKIASISRPSPLQA